MKNFLSYKHFDRFGAPKLNPDGTVAHDANGAPIYIEETPAVKAPHSAAIVSLLKG